MQKGAIAYFVQSYYKGIFLDLEQKSFKVGEFPHDEGQGIGKWGRTHLVSYALSKKCGR